MLKQTLRFCFESDTFLKDYTKKYLMWQFMKPVICRISAIQKMQRSFTCRRIYTHSGIIQKSCRIQFLSLPFTSSFQ